MRQCIRRNSFFSLSGYFRFAELEWCLSQYFETKPAADQEEPFSEANWIYTLSKHICYSKADSGTIATDRYHYERVQFGTPTAPLRQTIFFSTSMLFLENFAKFRVCTPLRVGPLMTNHRPAAGCIVVLNKHRNEDKQHSLQVSFIFKNCFRKLRKTVQVSFFF